MNFHPRIDLQSPMSNRVFPCTPVPKRPLGELPLCDGKIPVGSSHPWISCRTANYFKLQLHCNMGSHDKFELRVIVFISRDIQGYIRNIHLQQRLYSIELFQQTCRCTRTFRVYGRKPVREWSLPSYTCFGRATVYIQSMEISGS